MLWDGLEEGDSDALWSGLRSGRSVHQAAGAHSCICICNPFGWTVLGELPACLPNKLGERL